MEKSKIPTLASVIRQDVLPQGFTDEGDLIEAAKRAAARHRLHYTGSAIRRALASAQAQVAKQVRS